MDPVIDMNIDGAKETADIIGGLAVAAEKIESNCETQSASII